MTCYPQLGVLHYNCHTFDCESIMTYTITKLSWHTQNFDEDSHAAHWQISYTQFCLQNVQRNSMLYVYVYIATHKLIHDTIAQILNVQNYVLSFPLYNIHHLDWSQLTQRRSPFEELASIVIGCFGNYVCVYASLCRYIIQNEPTPTTRFIHMSTWSLRTQCMTIISVTYSLHYAKVNTQSWRLWNLVKMMVLLQSKLEPWYVVPRSVIQASRYSRKSIIVHWSVLTVCWPWASALTREVRHSIISSKSKYFHNYIKYFAPG